MSSPILPAAAPTKKHRRWLLGRIFVAPGAPGDVIIYSHSNLFYWWPVWAVSFVLAAMTYFEDNHMAIVPHDTTAARSRQVEVDGGQMEQRDVLILKKGKPLPANPAEDTGDPMQPRIYLSLHKTLGVIFMFVLLLVIIITNVPMRGLWSLLTILILVFLSTVLALLGVWEQIFAHTRLLAVHINLGGYLFLGLALFAIWLVNFVLFDRQVYVIITPGQVRVHLSVGGGEMSYDAAGMVFEKKRSDMFRHWILGFGSGDLIIRPANSREPIEMLNVMNVGRRVHEVESRLQEKAIVAAH